MIAIAKDEVDVLMFVFISCACIQSKSIHVCDRKSADFGQKNHMGDHLGWGGEDCTAGSHSQSLLGEELHFEEPHLSNQVHFPLLSQELQLRNRS